MKPHVNLVPLRAFVERYKDGCNEESSAKIFWNELIHDVFAVPKDTETFINFEVPVEINSNVKKIDAFIPSTRVLIEHKSSNHDLDEKIHQSDGVLLTPFEQAKRYNDALGTDNRARWIVTCNFKKIRIYDVRAMAYPEPQEIKLVDLKGQINRLLFLVDPENSNIEEVPEVTQRAAEKIKDLYDELLPEENDPCYAKKVHDLNVVCVRLVFCFYCESAELFGIRSLLRDYIEKHKFELRRAIDFLFRYLNLDKEGRLRDNSHYEKDTPDLAQFPYVDGGLFNDTSIDVDDFKASAPAFLATAVAHDWENINPTIFGALFESTLDPASRHSGGMHYTTEGNIEKVLFPLFLDECKIEFENIRNSTLPLAEKEELLLSFQNKIAKLKFLDPACGSGNFLTHTYVLLRRLENEVLKELPENKRQIKVSLDNFYGIEINDYAVEVARVALWIAEHQMIKESETILPVLPKFLPLNSYPNIIEANALRVDWKDVCGDVDYVIGNPPYLGYSLRNERQRKDLKIVDPSMRKNVDYVAGWFFKASQFIQNTKTEVCFVSTNSLTQGEHIASVWKNLIEKYNIRINFAYESFKWESESKDMAEVVCIIVCFATFDRQQKFIFDKNCKERQVEKITGYLDDRNDVIVSSRSKPLCDAPEIGIGNQPIDGGNYLFTEDEMLEFIKKEPKSKRLFVKWYGAEEFVKGKPRYCLWLGKCTPRELKSMRHCYERVKKVREYRLASQREGTRKMADAPTHFDTENMPSTDYLVISKVSTQSYTYIPMGFLTPDVFCSDLLFLIPGATLYHFSILTSSLHNVWAQTVCGRLGIATRYSKSIVYNNFPWPTVTEQQKEKLAQCGQKILDARAEYPDSSLATLYDDATMPTTLRKAHRENDLAVLEAYGLTETMTETEIINELMKLYNKFTLQTTNK